MIFSSPVFLFLFLPLVLAMHYVIDKKFHNILLLGASLIFYAWGEPYFIVLMLISIILNYLFGLLVEIKNTKVSKLFFSIAIICNLLIIAKFKYFNFFWENINWLLGILHINPITIQMTALPIGISFYTFHAISYLFDIYRKKVKAQRNPIALGLYIAFFPQLIAGPIIRYNDIEAQLLNRKIKIEEICAGLKRFIFGLGKKLIIANPLGAVADQLFGLNQSELTFSLSWLAVICYTLQIYFDFSGYSDMAIGLAKVFGFTFKENFNYPYISQSITEFWRRWHISLSSWFKDYLYIPLGGNRCKPIRMYFNLFLVFLTTGLWHGASWSFIVWGLYHGIFLIFEKSPFYKIINTLWSPLRNLYAVLVIMLGWVFFRSENLPKALHHLAMMFGWHYSKHTYQHLFQYLNREVIFTLVLAIVFSTPFFMKFTKMKYLLNHKNLYAGANKYLLISLENVLIFTIFLYSAMVLATQTYNPFIYFKF